MLAERGADLGHLLGDDLHRAEDLVEHRVGVGGQARAVAHLAGHAVHRGDGLGGLAADAVDEPLDVGGGVLRTAGQAADLVGHDREAAAVLAGAGGLDGRVEREQVDLVGDVADHVDQPGDVGRERRQLADQLGRAVAGLLDRAHPAHDLGQRVAALAGERRGARRRVGHAGDDVVDARDGARDLLGALRDVLGGGVEVLHRGRGLTGAVVLLGGALGHLVDALGDLARGARGELGRLLDLATRGVDAREDGDDLGTQLVDRRDGAGRRVAAVSGAGGLAAEPGLQCSQHRRRPQAATVSAGGVQPAGLRPGAWSAWRTRMTSSTLRPVLSSWMTS